MRSPGSPRNVSGVIGALAAAFVLCLALQAGSQEDAGYRDQQAEPANGAVDFCSTGKFLIFTGNCRAPADSPYRDAISVKACADVNAALKVGLSSLYPNAKVYAYKGLTPDALHETLAKSSVLGFFLVGEGDVNGGLVTGPASEVAYPEQTSCVALYDVFGGFTSHSKYSPDAAAPEKVRGRILARTQIIYRGQGAPAGSWPKVCHPKVSLVYPTRTFAGRMKNDALKLIGELQEQKKAQVLEVLKNICASCDSYTAAGSPLAALCPPNSDACAGRRLTPDAAEFLLKNYCYAIHPELAPAE